MIPEFGKWIKQFVNLLIAKNIQQTSRNCRKHLTRTIRHVITALVLFVFENNLYMKYLASLSFIIINLNYIMVHSVFRISFVVSCFGHRGISILLIPSLLIYNVLLILFNINIMFKQSVYLNVKLLT